MDPLSALRASYSTVLFGIELERIPHEAKTSLELVRTCHADLQYLVELRNEILPVLERRPKVAERVNNIIEAAREGLLEACKIVEKCRSQSNNGKTPFRSRISWILLEPTQFRGQKDVISRHHAAVLAEMTFLRQIALLSPANRDEEIEDSMRKPSQVFDNIALLGDIMATTAIPGTGTPFPLKPQSNQSFSSNVRPALRTETKPPNQSYSTNLTPAGSVPKVDMMTNVAMVPHTSGSLAEWLGSTSPYPGRSHSAAPERFEELKAPFVFSSPNEPPLDSNRDSQSQGSDTPRRPKSISESNVVFDSSDAAGLALMLEEQTTLTPSLRATTLLTTRGSRLSFPNAMSPYRPVSSVSSFSSLHDAYSSTGPQTHPTRWTDSMISLESSYRIQRPSISPITGQVSPSIYGKGAYTALSEDPASRASSSSVGTANPPSSPSSTSSFLRQHKAGSSQPPFESSSGQQSPWNSSPSFNTRGSSPYHHDGPADEVSRTRPFSSTPPHMIQSQGGASSGEFGLCGLGTGYKYTRTRPSPLSHSISQPSQSQTTRFLAEQQPISHENLRFQHAPRQQSSPTAGSSQKIHHGYRRSPEIGFDAVSKPRLDQAGLYEMMGSIPTTPQCRTVELGLKISHQATSLYGGSVAINKEPQELSSVRFEPEPVELP